MMTTNNKNTFLMLCFFAASALTAPTACIAGPDSQLALGRSLTPEEIQARDIDIMPDGHGLPSGNGSAAEGKGIYETKCMQCHGVDGKGASAAALAGAEDNNAFPFTTDPHATRTIGNYWPYATTLFDYIRRAMPFDSPGSLNDDEVYAVTAYLLSINNLIDEGAVMNAETLPKVAMPAQHRFTPDTRRGGEEIR